MQRTVPDKPVPQPPGRAVITGRATAEGTRSFSRRFGKAFADDFYREAAGLTVSSIGMGTYLGECDDDEDSRYVAALGTGIRNGLNLLDTAINYRCQRSERAVGEVLRNAVEGGVASREELVVCTKAGYVPLDGSPPDSREDYDAYLEANYFRARTMSPSDLIAGGHCMAPAFLDDQIQRSRSNLGVECIDVYFLHNPEQQLDKLDRTRFLAVISDAFATLESAVANGHIGVYGCATWNGFRTFAANRNHLSLSELVELARRVGGKKHHFRIVQLPVNLAMTEAVRAPTQSDNGKNFALLDVARSLGISVVASAALMQAQLTRNLPPEVRALFPSLATDAQRAIAFVRALPVASALVGMRSTGHVTENLAAAGAPTPA